MLPILRLKQPPLQIPWADLDREFDSAPKHHDLELGQSLSTWNWDENRRVDLDPWFEPVRQLVTQQFQQLLATDEPYESWVMNTWMNRHWRTGQTAQHRHEGCDLVFSCYLSVPPNSGALLIKWEDTWWRVPVESGDILVFPGNIEHATEASQTDEPRTVLTINASATARLWRDIDQPEALVRKGLTWPEALGLIRHQHLEAHTLYHQRQTSLAQLFIKHATEVFEPQPILQNSNKILDT